MIRIFIKKAVQDTIANRLLNSITIITIGLSVLIVSSLTLFFLNANLAFTSWQKGIRVLAYLKPDADAGAVADLERQIRQLKDVQQIRFISKEEALAQLKDQMKHQSAILEHIEPNPLPDAFEIIMDTASQPVNEIEDLAKAILRLPSVESVEYGQQWIGRFTHILSLFQFAGYAMGSLFFVATLLIIANTIRLVLYSRKEEVEIMRLVGATDRFIKMPFYIEGLLLGFLGGILGIGVLFAAYQFVIRKFQANLSLILPEFQFLSLEHFSGFIFGSMTIGWIGCYLSLKQFLKR